MATIEPFHVSAFSVALGLQDGLTRGAMRGPRFSAPFYGIREGATVVEPLSPADKRLAEYAPQLWELRLLAERYAPRLRPGQFFSHETALGLLHSPTPDEWKPLLHVSCYRPAAAPSARGVSGHRLQIRTPAWTLVGGLPVENPARAWVQASDDWPPDDLIAAADHLVLTKRRLATIDELRAEAAAFRGRALDAVLDDVRDGAESFRETALRLACQRGGLPAPTLNTEVFTSTGRFIARIDQLYPRYRVAAEYDGRQHAMDAAQFARDADRTEAIRAAGWDHIRILRHHLEPDPAPAVAKIAAALTRGGWRP
ncbi:hypothetical protein [uncultured Microbacterium sp.]|uniref:hypothetical protein n=1 Tax=uncultured Microbacterium sp. TaxID=191216 RepID=UPI0035CBC7FC